MPLGIDMRWRLEQLFQLYHFYIDLAFHSVPFWSGVYFGAFQSGSAKNKTLDGVFDERIMEPFFRQTHRFLIYFNNMHIEKVSVCVYFYI